MLKRWAMSCLCEHGTRDSGRMTLLLSTSITIGCRAINIHDQQLFLYLTPMFKPTLSGTKDLNQGFSLEIPSSQTIPFNSFGQDEIVDTARRTRVFVQFLSVCSPATVLTGRGGKLEIATGWYGRKDTGMKADSQADIHQSFACKATHKVMKCACVKCAHRLVQQSVLQRETYPAAKTE